MHPPLGLRFISLILRVGTALLNLVTAILVEATLETGKLDEAAREEHRQEKMRFLVPQIEQLFHQLDTDGSGEISLEERLTADPMVHQMLREMINVESLPTFFQLLDWDSGGSVDIEEFSSLLHRISATGEPTYAVELRKSIENLHNALEASRRSLAHNLASTDYRMRKLEGSQAAQQASREGKIAKLQDLVEERMSELRNAFLEVKEAVVSNRGGGGAGSPQAGASPSPTARGGARAKTDGVPGDGQGEQGAEKPDRGGEQLAERESGAGPPGAGRRAPAAG